MLGFRRNCCLSTAAVVLAFLTPFMDAAPQMRWVTNPQLQMGILPAEVQTHYTGNRNYGRPSVRSDFYRDFLYNPDTSYFKYPFFHSDWSPTNYINAQWTSTTVRPYPYGGGAGAAASAPAEAQSDSESPSRVAPSVRGTRTVPDPPYPSDYYYSYYPTTTARTQNGRPNYNYNYNYGNGNWNSQTAAPSRPQVIDDYWNTPAPTVAPARATTTEETLRGVWYAGSTTTTRRIPSESQVRDWETVPTTTTAAHEYSWWNTERTTTPTPRSTPEPMPESTTARYTTPYTTTTTTTTTPRTTTTNFETEDEIKAEAEVEDSGPRDENEDDDSDEDDDDDEDEWDLDF